MKLLSISILLMIVTSGVVLVSGPASALVSEGPGATCETAGRTLAGAHTFSFGGFTQYFRVPTTSPIFTRAQSADPSTAFMVSTHPVGTCDPTTCSGTGGCLVTTGLDGTTVTHVVIGVTRVSGTGATYTLLVAAAHPVKPEVFNNPSTQTCVVYNDENANNGASSSEIILQLNCAFPRVPNLTVSGCTLYDDINNNGVIDAGETILGIECPPDAEFANHGDGTCTVYVDNNGSSSFDAGDNGLTFLCPEPPRPKLFHDTVNGRYIVYDDKNNNDQVDSGETILIVEEYP